MPGTGRYLARRMVDGIASQAHTPLHDNKATCLALHPVDCIETSGGIPFYHAVTQRDVEALCPTLQDILGHKLMV